MLLKDADVDTSSTSLLQAINISKGGIIVAAQVRLAVTSAQRRQGLLGRNSLQSEEGVYLTPCEWIHTFGMRFPIDVAFLAADGSILAIHHNLRPNRLSKIVLRADGVLELSPGRLKATRAAVGDVILLQNSRSASSHSPEAGKTTP